MTRISPLAVATTMTIATFSSSVNAFGCHCHSAKWNHRSGKGGLQVQLQHRPQQRQFQFHKRRLQSLGWQGRSSPSTYTSTQNRNNMILSTSTATPVTNDPSSLSSDEINPTNDNHTTNNANTITNNTHDDNPLNLSNYPDIRAFNCALEDIAIQCQDNKSSSNHHIDAIGKATLAEAMVLTLRRSNPTCSFSPDRVTYNTLLKVWAKTAQTLAEGRGRGDVHDVFHSTDTLPQELEEDMKKIHGDGYDVLSARDAARRALRILNDWEERYFRSPGDGEGGGDTVHAGADEVVGPDVQGYNIVMDGWVKSRARDNAVVVEELFEKMQRWSELGVQDGELEIRASVQDEDEHDQQSNPEEEIQKTGPEYWKRIKPDAITYSICMDAWGHYDQSSSIGTDNDNNTSNDKTPLKRVMELLNSIEGLYEETGDETLKPNIRVANTAINAFAKYYNNQRSFGAGGSTGTRSKASNAWSTAKKAHDIYNRWNRKYLATNDEDYKPDVATFTSVIDAYARCGDVAATERAAQLFDHMQKQWRENQDLKAKPNSRTFTAIITAWSKTLDPRSPHKTEELLKLMEDWYAEDLANGETNSKLKPSVRTYTAAITSWARSRDSTKPQRALRILKKLNDMYKQTGDDSIKPNLFTYNAAIDACAKCNGTSEQQAEALKIAFAINKSIGYAKIDPNHVTYATLLKAANKLIPAGDQRNQVVRAVFEKCRKGGFVDRSVLKSLQLAADRNLYYELLESITDRNGFVTFDDIPAEWSKNVRY